jgi:hypothetical protein
MARSYRWTREDKEQLVYAAIKNMDRQPDGTFDLAEVERRLIPMLPPVDLEEINRRRVLEIIADVTQEKVRVHETEAGFFLPSGRWIDIDRDRFVKNNRGGIVEYMQAHVEDIRDESDREHRNREAVDRKDDAKRAFVDELFAWQMRERRHGRADFDLTLGNFHIECAPLSERPDDDEAA